MKIKSAMISILFPVVVLCNTAPQGAAMVIENDTIKKAQQNLEEESYDQKNRRQREIKTENEYQQSVPSAPDATEKDEEIEVVGEFFGESFFEREPSKEIDGAVTE